MPREFPILTNFPRTMATPDRCSHIVATFSSLSLTAVFLHPGDALHGDMGIVAADDVVLLLSNSGETEELLAILPPQPRPHRHGRPGQGGARTPAGRRGVVQPAVIMAPPAGGGPRLVGAAVATM